MKFAPHEVITLPNGLRVLWLPVEHTASVFVSMTGKVGRRAESDDEVGAAHFLEHLLFDGTKRRPSYLAINEFVEQEGAIVNGSTGQEEVSYYAKAMADKADTIFDFLSDIFLNSLLKDVEKERRVIAQEAAAKRDDPGHVLDRLRLGTLYPGQSIGRTVFDEDVNLHNMDHDNLSRYMARNYVAQNFVLTVAGNISRELTGELAEKYFAGIKGGRAVKFDTPRLEPDEKVIFQHRDLTQAKLSIAFRGAGMRDQPRFAARMLASILGSGISSRLQDRLRNQLEIVYSIGAGAATFSDTGFFTIVTYLNEDNLQQAVDEIFDQLDRASNQEITPREIEKARNRQLSSFAFAMENVAAYADYHAGQLVLQGDIESIDQHIESIRAVTADDIKQAARTIFSDPPKINILAKSAANVTVPRLAARA